MSDTKPRLIFVNLPVADLARSVEFFTKLGFAFDPRFTDEQATCMIVSDKSFVMLLVEDRFRDFTNKPIADARTQTEAILSVSADSRADVDQLVDAALEAGARPGNVMGMDFMYGRGFDDLDGHMWEIIWMDAAVGR